MKTKKIPLKLAILLCSILLMVIGSCEKSAEEKFDHSLIPGKYESWILPRGAVPEFIVEISKVSRDSYTFDFPDSVTSLPDQLSVSIAHYIEDPSRTTDAIMACVRLTGESEFELFDSETHDCSGYFQIVPFHGEIHYHLSLLNTSTDWRRYIHGMRH